MATQRRSWIARVSVVAAVSLGALVGVTAPAWAAPHSLVGATLSPNTITVGQTSTFKFKIKDAGAPPRADLTGVAIQVSGNASCEDNCNPNGGNIEFGATGESGEVTAKIKGNAAGQAQIKVVHSGGQIGNTYTLTINSGQQEAQTVGMVRGDVRNIADAKPIGGAVVTVSDPTGKTWTAQTNSSGLFQFDGKALKIAPGVLIFTVTKDPFVLSGGPRNVQVAAGENKQVPSIGMENPTAATTPPATPTDAPPSTDASASAGAGPIETKAAADSGGLDTMTWIMIIVGGLLVALGIGAIVLLLVRRNNEDDEEDEEDDEDDEPVRGRPVGPRGPAGAGVRPAGGVYGGPAGGAGTYGRPADATMIQRPGMGDAPTQMHRPSTDQYGNPTQVYGQQPAQPGWGPPQPGYGPPPAGGAYGQASGGGAYGQASGGGAYGQASGGGAYGQASGGGAYSQSSGGGAYGAPPPPPPAQQPGWGGYDQQAGGYGQPQPGYGAPNQYEEPTQYAGPTSGGYGGGQQPGYDAAYGQQAYGSPSGYPPPDPYGSGNGQPDPYGAQQPGYGQQQGYPDDRRNRGDRRLDWLDD